MHDLRDFSSSCTLWCNFNPYRIAQKALCERCDFLWHGCREQSCLAVLMRAFGNALHIIDEAHVEHAVGFIENQPAGF